MPDETAAAGADAPIAPRALHAERIEVGTVWVEALVRAAPGMARTRVFADLAPRALELLPGLVGHTCRNGSARGIAAELADTETAHLLEHVALELMALSGSPRDLRADTRWDFSADGPGMYRIRLEYDVDLVALGALREGIVIVDWLSELSAERPGVEAIVEKLRAARGGA